jgi:Putative peptidoglycan binding domain
VASDAVDMPTQHVVTKGECLSSIAADYGYPDYRIIYDDPANAELKTKRPNPNVLCPGDVLVIPDRAQTSFPCATGQTQQFVVQLPEVVTRIEVGVAEAHFYELTVGDQIFKGKTDGQSPIEHPISPLAESGQIELWPATAGNDTEKDGAFSWDLQFGHLDPIEEISGVQGRLANLGYYAGPIDGETGPELELAIGQFESDAGLDVTGDVKNGDMQKKLQASHDGSS